MWLIATYESVALFSLKSALATSSGGKSLLVPTPFSMKMALLDAGYRLFGASHVADIWPSIRDLDVAIDLPASIVVSNVFTRILKPRRGSPAAGSAHAGPFQKTIGFREYVSFGGPWRLALGVAQGDVADKLQRLLLQVNYLGKRGGFIQIVELLTTGEALPDTFTILNPRTPPTSFELEGTLQVLDDCGSKMTLAHADIYSSARIATGKQRRLNNVVLPCRLSQSSRGYSLYERIPSA